MKDMEHLQQGTKRKHETAREDTLEILKFRKVSGAGSGLVRHEAAEKAAVREAARAHSGHE